jgi:hypothetical protein
MVTCLDSHIDPFLTRLIIFLTFFNIKFTYVILPLFHREYPVRLSSGIIRIFQNVCNLLIKGNGYCWHLSIWAHSSCMSPSSALHFLNSSICSWLGRCELQLPGGCSMVVTQMGQFQWNTMKIAKGTLSTERMEYLLAFVVSIGWLHM